MIQTAIFQLWCEAQQQTAEHSSLQAASSLQSAGHRLCAQPIPKQMGARPQLHPLCRPVPLLPGDIYWCRDRVPGRSLHSSMSVFPSHEGTP